MDELAVKVREAIMGKATWDSTYVSSLPDASFAYICPGGTKEDGKTSPGSLRKLPYKDADGAVDLPHTRNALARLNQVKCGDEVISESLQDKIRSKLEKALASAKESEKMAQKALSYSREMQAVSIAFEQKFTDGYDGYWAAEVLDDAVIASSFEDPYGVYHRVSYTKTGDGTYEFAEQDKWSRGRYQFVADES